METIELYSTFTDSGHTLMTVHKGINLVCLYSSVNSYKLRSFSNLLIYPEFSIGNHITSLKVDCIEGEELKPDDEDTIYECYDTSSVVVTPSHDLFFNTVIIMDFDWAALRQDVDFKLMNLDVSKFNAPYYFVNRSTNNQIMCNLKTARLHCKHRGKRITTVSGGYKQILFDVVSGESFTCPCSLLTYLGETFAKNNFNYVLLSYKLTQLYLHF